MINDNEVLRLKNTNSVLEAVKYVKNASGLSLTDCKKYVDNLLDNTPLNTGTITWISVDKEKPPAWKETDENTYGYSHDVLCCDKTTGRTWKDLYCHNPVNGIPYWHTGQEPTHFAYINLPE